MRHFNRKVEEYRPQIEAFFTTIGEAILSFQAGFEERIKLYPKLLAEVAPMAQRGWFISGYLGLSDILKLANLCGTVTADDLDRHVAYLYRTSLVDHTESLLRDYPTRAFAIQPAIEAHQRGEYALSVPVFFAQSEGICYDVAKKYIFRNQDGENIQDFAKDKLALIETIDASANPYDTFSRFMEIMLRPFADALPVGYSEKDRSKHGYSGLNRHTVLHGIALAEYATEENSLKAFSLLSHVAALMSQHKDDP